MDELWDQTKAIYNPTDDKPAAKFTKQIAFNVIPHIDVFMDDGATKEEWKMVAETKKIVDPKIKVTATCVRVPVFVGHSEAVNIEFEDHLDEDEAREVLRTSPGILVVDKREDGGYITPVECVGDFRHLCQPHPSGPDHRQRAEPVGGQRQPQERRGPERRADCRASGQPGAEEGLSFLAKTVRATGAGRWHMLQPITGSSRLAVRFVKKSTEPLKPSRTDLRVLKRGGRKAKGNQGCRIFRRVFAT